MRIIFMGTPEFAVPGLELLLANGYTVSAVVTAPDKPRGRGQQVSHTAVKECALRHAIPVLQPESLRDPAFIASLSAHQADLFIVVAFRILPKEVYTLPALGSFNLHASLLPKYRGAAPINWALINGETESGVTTFFLQEKVDTGNIILQRSIPLPPEMDAGQLHDALSELGARTVLETVRLIESGNARPLPQSDALATPAPKIFKETCRIRWDRPARELHNFIRGLSPYPAAWTNHGERMIKIYRTAVSSQLSAVSPGRVMAENGRLFVSTADGVLEVLQLQQEGKKQMSAEEFLRGYRFGAEDVLI
ncbi:MAG: methionyl-tRNA formyltransferase [Bacteroidetes bacterium]|nr:methionyl-tRNA formyltransferase [Bacteroidota bacterium]